MGGGAWPFLVGGAICLVNSDNERDSSLLNRWLVFNNRKIFGFAVLLDPGFAASRRLRVISFRTSVRCGVFRRRRPPQSPRKANCVLASVTTLLRGTSGV